MEDPYARKTYIHLYIGFAWTSMAVIYTLLAPKHLGVRSVCFYEQCSVKLVSFGASVISCQVGCFLLRTSDSGPGGAHLDPSLGRQSQEDLSSRVACYTEFQDCQGCKQKLLKECDRLFPKPHVPRRCPLNFTLGVREILLAALSLKPTPGAHILNYFP